MAFAREVVRKFGESNPREAHNVIQFRLSFGPGDLVSLAKASRRIYVPNGTMAKTEEGSSEN